MAKPIARKGKKQRTGRREGTASVQRRPAKKAARKLASTKQPAKTGKQPAKTAVGRKSGHKAGNKAGVRAGNKPARAGNAVDHGLVTAFHHMQRASVVMSLMEKGTGEDLRDLLQRGVMLYRRAILGDARHHLVLRAIGVLRAAEHLSMAGLYAARDEHSQKVASPPPHWLENVIAETSHRLEKMEHAEPSKGPDLFAVTVQLLRQAVESDYDAHLAFEFAMAADALCFALEHGL